MDTLSSSVSTLKVPALHSTPSRHELNHFKTTLLYSKPHPNKTTTTTTCTIQAPFSPTFLSTTSPPPSLAAPSPSPSPPSPLLHRKPATGYAAALLDIAQANNSVDLVGQDVERLLKLMRDKRVQAVLSSALVGDKEKGQVVRDLAEKGRFSRHLVRLVKMLVEKNKVGVVKQVLEEFEKVYDEMLGTQVVLISSAKKIEEDRIFGIAKRVQRLTGAFKVKVKNLVRHNSFSFAV